MACFAKHWVRVGDRLYSPGERIDKLTNKEWKQLMADKAIENKMDPSEVVEAEADELMDDDDDEIQPDPEGDADDQDGEGEPGDGDESEEDGEPEAEDAQLDEADMPDVSGADSVVEQAPAAPKPRGKGKKEAQGDVDQA